MPHEARTREKDFTAAAELRRSSSAFLNRRVWLPGFIYHALPFFYMFAGLTALATTIFIGAWFWVVPHYLLFSVACLHLYANVMRKRRNLVQAHASHENGESSCSQT